MFSVSYRIFLLVSVVEVKEEFSSCGPLKEEDDDGDEECRTNIP